MGPRYILHTEGCCVRYMPLHPTEQEARPMFDAFAKAQADGELAAAELAATATNLGVMQAAM